MGAEDARRQHLNVERMKLLGAEVREVDAGSRTLKDAINEALRDWVTHVRDTHYVLGSVLGPHPFPTHGARLPSRDRRRGARAVRRARPAGCPTCWSPASAAAATRSGCSTRSSTTRAVRKVGVEAGGHGLASGRHAARIPEHSVGVLHGTRTLVLQDARGMIRETHSVSAGLDYPALGPEHAWLADQGLAEYSSATDAEALDGVRGAVAARGHPARARDRARAGLGAARGAGARAATRA